MNADTQDMIVLNHMQKHKSITSYQAFEMYGITRLSAKIYNLRQIGYKIGMVWEHTYNRYGIPVKYGRFFIIQEPKKQTLMDKILSKTIKKQ